MVFATLGSAALGGCDSGTDCTNAGGQCMLGPTICAVPGTQSCTQSGGPITPGGAYCCLSQVADCGQPDGIAYEACPPPSDAGAACKGTPPVPAGAPDFQSLEEARDDDASFPIGCTVTFPVCFNGHPNQCTCSAGAKLLTGYWSCVF
jgi:hypothetical protein